MHSHSRRQRFRNFTLRDEVFLWTTLAQKFKVARETRYFDSTMPTEPKKVDFLIKDEKRTFALKLSDRSVYVNPHFFATMSEKFKQDYALINDEHGEVSYRQFPSRDMRSVLECICPTIYGLYPLPVKIKELPLILPIAVELQMPGLKLCCEKIIEENLPMLLKNTDALLTVFDLACRFHLDSNLQAKLLRHLVIRKFPSEFPQIGPVATVTGNLLMLGILKSHQRLFLHDERSCLLKPSSDHGVQCAICVEKGVMHDSKLRKKNGGKTGQESILLSHYCEDCTEFWCEPCGPMPCKSKLRAFLTQYLPIVLSQNV